jgi:hypothetical protein
LTQSMCRTVDPQTEQEQSACINCKSACMDIDAEKSYWQSLKQPGRKLVQYGYLGLVIGYFIYYWLYAGNLDYYFSGAWSHEAFQISRLFSPGLFWHGRAIALPKLIAAPLTMAISVVLTCGLVSQIERYYITFWNQKHGAIDSEVVTHRIFSLCSFLAFNLFFIYGGRPELLRMPLWAQFLAQAIVILVSSLWLAKVWRRSSDRYMRESLADNLRRQLKKLPINVSLLLDGRSVDQLNADEVYILAKTLPHITQQDRLMLYQGVLIDALQAEHVTSMTSLVVLQRMRQVLGITEEQHYQLLGILSQDHQTLHLIYPELPKTVHRERRKADHLAPSLLQEVLTRFRQDNDSN